MYTMGKQSKDAGLVLSGLLEIIGNFSGKGNVFLDDNTDNAVSGTDAVSNPCNFMRANESVPAEFFEAFGIRSVSLNAFTNDLKFSDETVNNSDTENKAVWKWHDIKNSAMVEELSNLFKGCRIIPFTNWSNVYSASDLWYGLLSDVIKPLNKKDFEFIFYLGDPTRRRVFEVDEILDIISEFSHYGRVTFVMDENEAMKLWGLLYGQNPDIDLSALTVYEIRAKYLAIFNTVNIENLVVYSTDQAMLFSKKEHFEITRRKPVHIKTTSDLRDSFCAGYGLGLQKQLDIPLCIGLGITVSGAYSESGNVPDKNELLAYIHRWAVELEASKTE